MPVNTPDYRTDYVGETIHSNRNGESITYFATPRPNVFTKVGGSTAAIVLGNGPTRNSNEVKQLIRINSNKVAQAYKLTYACNSAIIEPENYDYYVMKSKFFLTQTPMEKRQQVYVPYDIYIDFQEDCNLIPYKSYYDAGISAAYIAAFHGHKQVFLMGFDGDLGGGWKTVYDGRPHYGDGTTEIDYSKWQNYFYEVMRQYADTQFYRLQLDGQCAPDLWKNLDNFRDVTMREAVVLGDF
jgi:hypothetical protein